VPPVDGFQDPTALEGAYGLVQDIFQGNCFPDDLLHRAFFEDRLRLVGNSGTGDAVLWDGGAAPTGMEFPVQLHLWVDPLEQCTKENCTCPIPPITSSADMVAIAWWVTAWWAYVGLMRF
jgi:hypothetical protein